MTTQDMVNAVQGNLGDRDSGTIGGQATATVVLRAISASVQEAVKLANPTAYEKVHTLAMPSGGAQTYAVPTVEDMKIKDILSYRFLRASDGGTLNVVKVSYPQFIQVTPSMNRGHQGTPSYWSIHGGIIYINRIPAEDYNLEMYCELFPKEVGVADLNLALPIGTEWELCIEAYASYYCFLKLQQAVSASYWKDLYEDQKSTNTQVKRKVNQRGGGWIAAPSTRSELDPFVYSNRANQH